MQFFSLQDLPFFTVLAILTYMRPGSHGSKSLAHVLQFAKIDTRALTGYALVSILVYRRKTEGPPSPYQRYYRKDEES
jgi:hypothetical protein